MGTRSLTIRVKTAPELNKVNESGAARGRERAIPFIKCHNAATTGAPALCQGSSSAKSFMAGLDVIMVWKV